MKSHRTTKAPSVSATEASDAIKFRWLIADDIRNEVSGKLTLVGLYPDNSIVIEMPADAADPSSEAPIHIPGLTILCVITGMEGPVNVAFKLGETKTAEVETHGELGSSRSVIFRIPLLVVQTFGIKKVTLEASQLDIKAEFEFKVGRRNVPVQQPPAGRSAPLANASKKSLKRTQLTRP